MFGRHSLSGCPKKLLPITRSLLHKMLMKVELLVLSDFQHTPVKALLLLAYHTCARVGELLISSNADHTIKLENMFIKYVNGYPTIKFVLPSYKHSKEETQFLLEPAEHPNWCPVRHLLLYLKKRGNQPGYLFLNQAGTPIRKVSLQTKSRR